MAGHYKQFLAFMQTVAQFQICGYSPCGCSHRRGEKAMSGDVCADEDKALEIHRLALRVIF